MKYTKEQYNALQELYDYYNRTLFDNTLDEVILTFSRGKKYHGFFWSSSWKVNKANSEEKTKVSEISLNPESLTRSPEVAISTLVHEQVHMWQDQHGKNKPKRAYHNKEWSAKMIEIGLMPVCGLAGKKTGQSCSHEIIEGGKYQKAFEAMPKHILLPLAGMTFLEQKKKYKKDKAKYHCPECELNVWGKPGLNLECQDCLLKLQEEGE